MQNKDNTLKLFENENNHINEMDIIKNIFVTAGPWIISIISLLTLKFLLKDLISEKDYDIFMNIIIYTFIFSMIVSAPFTNMINRYLGDITYLKEYSGVLPTFTSAILVIGVISYLSAFLYINQFTNLQEYQFSIAQFFTAISILWVVMIFVSILKNYTIINLSFLMGMIISIFLLTEHFHSNLQQMLMAYTSGVLFTVAILVGKLIFDFKSDRLITFEYFKQKKYYPFFFSGLFLYLALWVDKFIYWNSNFGVEVTKGFHFFPEYDFILFVSYLILIPTTSYLNVYIEQVFHKEQKNYFKAIENKKTFAIINNYAKNISNTFYRGLLRVSLLQAVISIIFIFLVQYIFDKLELNITTLPLLRITVFAITLQMILMAILIFLYYFDFQKEIVFITFLYFILNLSISYFMVDLTYDYVGYSYFVSVLITLIVTFLIASYKMDKINFYIIAKNEV